MPCRITNSAAAAAPLALFGIDNSGGIGIAANLLVVFLIAVWLALVFWAYADSRRRLTDPVLIGSATLAALIFPFAGALVYAIVRPPETLDDAYERELDVRAAELRVRLLESAVMGGPGSSAHASSVGAELTGEPSRRPSNQGGAQRQQVDRGAQAQPKPAEPTRAGQPRRTSEPPAGGGARGGVGESPRTGGSSRPGPSDPSRPSGRDR